MKNQLREALFVPLELLSQLVALVQKEWLQVIRRPGALVTLVIAPFAIMALFGVGYSGERRPLNTAIVLPSGTHFPSDPESYQQVAGPAIVVTRVTGDLEGARADLRGRRLDLIVVVPSDMETKFLGGMQATIGVEQDRVDPVRDAYTRVIADRAVQELNRELVRRTAQEGRQYLIQSGVNTPLSTIPADVMAAPTRAEVTNWAPSTPGVVGFFTPAVLALVLQHMAVTLTALSLVRERLNGVMDLYRVAPVWSVEILLGTYLAYGIVSLIISAAVITLAVFGLGVPLLGSIPSIAGVVCLLIFASLGTGMLISTVSDSERQAVQLSMLVLLASVFFSGFVLPLDEFTTPIQWLAYVLPVTHGISLLQDFMLRGYTTGTWQIWALGAIGMVLFLMTAVSLHSSLARSQRGS
jgi:ABC-2 type transport system permease protein